MRINVSARHGQLGTEKQQRIEEKVKKLRRLYDRITSIDVTVELGHQDYLDVEIRATVEQADDFVARNTASDVIAAVEGAEKRMEQQLRRYKDKQLSSRHSSDRHAVEQEWQGAAGDDRRES